MIKHKTNISRYHCRHIVWYGVKGEWWGSYIWTMVLSFWNIEVIFWRWPFSVFCKFSRQSSFWKSYLAFHWHHYLYHLNKNRWAKLRKFPYICIESKVKCLKALHRLWKHAKLDNKGFVMLIKVCCIKVYRNHTLDHNHYFMHKKGNLVITKRKCFLDIIL